MIRAVHAATRSRDGARDGARAPIGTTVIVIPVDREQRVGGYESWWDVPVAEVSTIEAVQKARARTTSARASAERDASELSSRRATVVPSAEAGADRSRHCATAAELAC